MSDKKTSKEDLKTLEALLSATLQLLDAKQGGKDVSEMGEWHQNFLSSFLANVVLRSLSGEDFSKATDNQKSKIAQLKIGSNKLKIQDSISLAFQVAMRKITGQELEYYVTIKTYPRAKNTLLN